MDEPQRVPWQKTVDIAVEVLEKRTGLKLTGLSQSEMTERVRDWMKAKTPTETKQSEELSEVYGFARK